VSGRQPRFEGSHRQARGRLLRALTTGPVAVGDASAVMGRPTAAAAQLVDALTAEGLVVQSDGWLRLP
jgi:DNA-binding IclR family transcriptional regulator